MRLVRNIALFFLLAFQGCQGVMLGPVGEQPTQAKPSKPQATSLRAAYFAALADGLESGWYASPNEFLARAKVTRERLKLEASGASVDGIKELQGATVKPFTADQRESVVKQLRTLAGG